MNPAESFESPGFEELQLPFEEGSWADTVIVPSEEILHVAFDYGDAMNMVVNAYEDNKLSRYDMVRIADLLVNAKSHDDIYRITSKEVRMGPASPDPKRWHRTGCNCYNCVYSVIPEAVAPPDNTFKPVSLFQVELEEAA